MDLWMLTRNYYKNMFWQIKVILLNVLLLENAFVDKVNCITKVLPQ